MRTTPNHLNQERFLEFPSIISTIFPITASNLPEDILFFESTKDFLGTKYQLKNHIKNTKTERTLLGISISRYLLYSIILNKEPHFNLNDFLIYKVETIQKWIKEQKEDSIDLMKVLLETLKSLINLHKNIGQGFEFAQNLDNIFQKLDKNSLISIPSLIFRAKIENIGKGSYRKQYENC